MADKIKLGFMQLNQGKTYKLHVIHEPGEAAWMRNLHYKQAIVDNMFCQHCEDEKIASRFDILDL
jgi:hypothetical protein